MTCPVDGPTEGRHEKTRRKTSLLIEEGRDEKVEQQNQQSYVQPVDQGRHKRRTCRLSNREVHFTSIPHATVYITYPWAVFPWLISPHSWNSVDAKNDVLGNISPTAFRGRIVRYWHPLGFTAIGLGKPPRGGVVYTVIRIQYRVLLPLLLLLLLLSVAILLLLLLQQQQQCCCFLLLFIIACRMTKSVAGSLNLIPVFSFSSFKRDLRLMVPLGSAVWHYPASVFAYIFRQYGRARSQGGRQPAAAKPAL